MANAKGCAVKKLYQLKKWLSIEDTARHLTIVFGEPVNEADVLQLGLDGHLKLSVNFVNGVVARLGKVVTINQAKMYILPKDRSNLSIEKIMPHYLNTVTLEDDLPEDVKKGLKDKTLTYSLKGILIRDNEVLDLEDTNKHFSDIRGVYDIPMLGGERLDIEHKYQMLTNGAEVTSSFLDGAFVVSPDGEWCQLQEHFDDNPYSNSNEKKKERAKKPLHHPDNYYPAGGLPHDSVLVVRTSELTDFESRISEASEKLESVSQVELGRRDQQHETILAIIAALDFDPLKIPDGGKAKIKTACLTRPRIFTDSSFDHAWKAGINANLLRMANHEKYSPS